MRDLLQVEGGHVTREVNDAIINPALNLSEVEISGRLKRLDDAVAK